MLIFNSCINCQKHSMTLFLKCHYMSNISVSIVTTVSDVIMLLTALYTAMMYSSSSQMMRTTTVLMKVNALLN